MVFRRTIHACASAFPSAAVGAVLMSPCAASAADLATPDVGGPPIVLVEETEDAGFTGYLKRRQVILGGGVMVAPEYEGSDKFTAMPVPLLSFNFGESIVVNPMGLEFTVFSRNNLSFRLNAQYDWGRDEDDSRYLKGLGDIDGGVLLGGTVGYDIGPVELYGTLERTFGGADGLQAIAGAVVTYPRGPLLLSAGASATWSDSDYMSAYFGITDRQSERSGLARHDAGSGFKRVDAEVFATYLISENWALRAQAGVGYLVGDAADSPIVQDKMQPSAMLMLGYRF